MYCILVIISRPFLFRMTQNLLPKSTRRTSRVYRTNCQLSSFLLKLVQTVGDVTVKRVTQGSQDSSKSQNEERGEACLYHSGDVEKMLDKKKCFENGFVDVNNCNRTNQLSSLSHFNHTYCSTQGKFYLFDHNPQNNF